MQTEIFQLKSRDFLEMQHTLSAWDHEYHQIGMGEFRGSIFSTQTGSLGIFRNRWERAIRYRGTAPRGSLGLAVSLAQPGEAHWMGQQVAFDDVIVQRSGAEAEYLSSPIWDAVVFAIPEADLMQWIAHLTRNDPEETLRGLSIARLSPQASAQLRQACRAYLDAAAESLVKPDKLALLPEMAEATVELVVHALVNSNSPRHPKQSVDRRFHLIRKTQDYCTQNTDQLLRIGDVCRELGVSERTLRDTFHKLAGISPLAYLKTHKLNRVHNVLYAADPAEVLVKQAAMKNGFLHFGQFSRDYKQLFGESPSETLQYRPVRVSGCDQSPARALRTCD